VDTNVAEEEEEEEEEKEEEDDERVVLEGVDNGVEECAALEADNMEDVCDDEDEGHERVTTGTGASPTKDCNLAVDVSDPPETLAGFARGAGGGRPGAAAVARWVRTPRGGV